MVNTVNILEQTGTLFSFLCEVSCVWKHAEVSRLAKVEEVLFAAMELCAILPQDSTLIIIYVE